MKISILPTAAVIRIAIKTGIKAGAYKGDLQDLVSAAVLERTGRKTLTIAEAAFAHNFLVSTGYVAPCGFAPHA